MNSLEAIIIDQGAKPKKPTKRWRSRSTALRRQNRSRESSVSSNERKKREEQQINKNIEQYNEELKALDLDFESNKKLHVENATDTTNQIYEKFFLKHIIIIEFLHAFITGIFFFFFFPKKRAIKNHSYFQINKVCKEV